MELSVLKVPGQETSVSSVEVLDSIFGYEFKEGLIHQVVTAYRAGARSGNHAQKSRSEVSGGGAKPWKQKGTGRARSGSNRSPIWRKGGVTFAAKPLSYEQKVNKKMYRNAVKSICSELLRQGNLMVVEKFELASHKTKELLTKLATMQLQDVLLITDSLDSNLYLASRNLHAVGVTDVVGVDPLALLKFSKVLITVNALKQLEEGLKK